MGLSIAKTIEQFLLFISGKAFINPAKSKNKFAKAHAENAAMIELYDSANA